MSTPKSPRMVPGAALARLVTSHLFDGDGVGVDIVLSKGAKATVGVQMNLFRVEILQQFPDLGHNLLRRLDFVRAWVDYAETDFLFLQHKGNQITNLSKVGMLVLLAYVKYGSHLLPMLKKKLCFDDPSRMMAN